MMANGKLLDEEWPFKLSGPFVPSLGVDGELYGVPFRLPKTDEIDMSEDESVLSGARDADGDAKMADQKMVESWSGGGGNVPRRERLTFERGRHSTGLFARAAFRRSNMDCGLLSRCWRKEKEGFLIRMQEAYDKLAASEMLHQTSNQLLIQAQIDRNEAEEKAKRLNAAVNQVQHTHQPIAHPDRPPTDPNFDLGFPSRCVCG